MATKTEEVEWVTYIKPISLPSCSNFNTSSLTNLISGVVKSEKAFEEDEKEYEKFYAPYAALCAHYLSSNAAFLDTSDSGELSEACKILIKYLLRKLQSYKEQCPVSQKHLMLLLKGLCKGSSSLCKSDVVTYTSQLRVAKLPPYIKTGDGEGESNQEPREFKRPRLDTGKDIFTQMTSLLEVAPQHRTSKGQGQMSAMEIISRDGDLSIASTKSSFANRNLQILHELDGEDVLLEICLDLPYLKRYIGHYEYFMQRKGLITPTIMSEAITVRASLQSVLNDISIVSLVFTLPVLEPLTSQRLSNIVTMVMACLQAAVSAVMATAIVDMATTGSAAPTSNKEEHIDTCGKMIMHRALEIIETVQTSIHQSTRAGGSHLRNFQLLIAMTEMKTLEKMLQLMDNNAADKPAKDVISKEVTGHVKSVSLGVLGMTMLHHVIGILSHLLGDMEEEHSITQMPREKTFVQLDLHENYTAQERMDFLLADLDLGTVLLHLLEVTFNKALQLKSPHRSTTEELSMEEMEDSCSDTNTCNYDDDFSSSSDHSTDDDDDSEPILGQLFKEVMGTPEVTAEPPPPPPPVPTRETKPKPARLESREVVSVLPDKRDPHGFINVATEILELFNNHMMKKHLGWLSEGRNLFTVTTENLSHVTRVITELQNECPNMKEREELKDFSMALALFCHNLVKLRLNTVELQESFLSALGVNPTTTDPWPLSIPTSSLTVLTEVILLLQQQERQGLGKARSDALITAMWTKCVDALVELAVSGEDKVEEEKDMNVEHSQVLMFLFHSLPLMQKKILLLQLAQKLCDIVSHFKKQSVNRMMETSPLATARLLLMMDYLLHYFYDPPQSLVHQVQCNLFAVNSSGSPAKEAWFVCKEVQDNYQQHSGKKVDPNGSPKFYNLAPTDYSSQEAPKIDGLACSFLLGNPEMLDYNQFYIACIELLAAGSKCQLPARDGNKYLAGASVHYHMVVLWRLLGSLPPSVQCLQQLGSLGALYKDSFMLHTIRWIPRLAHSAFSGWIKDCLVKQGLTTQQADSLLVSLVKKTDTVEYDISLARHFIQGQISVSALASTGEILPESELPLFTSVYMLDAVIAKVQVSLDELFVKSMDETDPRKNLEVAKDLVSATLLLIEAYTIYIRSSLLNKVVGSDTCLTTPAALRAYGTVLSIGSSAPPDMASFASSIMGQLPNPVRSVIDNWLHGNTFDFPTPGAWKNTYSNDIIPVESYLSAMFSSHLSTLSGQCEFSLNPSLRHTLNSLVSFLGDLIVWCPKEVGLKEGSKVLLPLACDATTEYTVKNYWARLEDVLGAQDSPEFLSAHYSHVLNACCELITTHANKESGLNEGILHQVLIYLEQQLDKPQGRVALHCFFTTKADLIKLLLSATSESLSHMYGTKVLKFFNKLFQLAEKFPNDKSYLEMCSSLSRVAQLHTSVLQGWLSKMITTPPPLSPSASPSDGDVVNLTSSQGTTTDAEAKLQENRLLLQSITSYIVKDGSHVGEEVAKAILNALIPMGSQILSPTNEGMGFSELVVVMATLAGAGSGAGHLALIQAATEWLELCKTYLSEPRVLEKLSESSNKGRHHTMLDSACYLLSYIGDILSALKHSQAGDRAVSPPHEGDSGPGQEVDSDWAEDLAIEEEDSGGEDSDDESLNSKLCTFTVTQKEFMNQHWYHCHTCKMVDGIGVCTVCAKVCHKDHDLSYAKYGSFFCDCGAKEDGSCIALVKRSVPSGLDSSRHEGQGPSPFSMESMLTSSLRRRLQPLSGSDRKSEGKKETEKGNKAREALCKQIQSWKPQLLTIIQSSNTVNVVIDLLRAIMPTVVDNYHQMSPVGSLSRAYEALERLKNEPKTCESTDQLMTATLGSQEGAFENVRMNFTGDQGQQIRQLINNHVLRRVAMCCLSSPHGKRQHLAVSHEKGKVTILQLSALLKQADSSKRKLTLTRLASAPIPFTVISITGNPCNEDFLAVCGLKECHVLTLTSGGSVSDHLVLHPSLDSGNFIIKALWLPGSQTELALVTADFVKVYDLSVDAISPQFYFLLPSGKVRDVTFICREDSRWLVVNTSSGYIYWQVMDDQSSATHGPFYITNILEVEHAEVKEQGGNVCGGGVSVFYSHMLQLLFFSYSQGKTFAASLPKGYEGTPKLFQITMKTNGGGGGGKNNSPQPLVGWSEVASHPGLVCAMTQSSNNPVILMVKPDTVQVQEIKVQPAKAKIQDMVVIRHSGGHSDQRTTLILLCEDGSLKIYMANTENTNYWLSPSLQPQNLISVLRPTKKKRPTKPGTGGGQVTFPVDFFEHCTQSSDVEFGGNDVLQLYNTAQLKHRLGTAGMNVASTKPNGFILEISNTNFSNVMVGLRVMVGSQNTERAPGTLEVFGRAIPVTAARSRWIDLPFTREESLTADKKCALTVGVSSDPNSVTMIDMVKVYCKTKETFGWPEDMEDYQEGSSSNKVPTSGTSPQFSSSSGDGDLNVMKAIPLTSVDRLLASSLEVLDGCFCSETNLLEETDPTRQATVALATQLLTLPVPTEVQQNTKNLLADLFSSKTLYHLHKDEAQLSTVLSSLKSGREQTGSDPETFQKLLLTARSVAIARPQNLVKFCESSPVTTSQAMDDQEPEKTSSSIDQSEQGHFLTQLVDMFWKLHAARPSNPLLAPACMPGLTQIEATVQAIIEIIHAFTTVDLDCVGVASKLYISLLLSQDCQVSFASKQALIRVLRPKQKKKRVFIPSPPRCSTPGGGGGMSGGGAEGGTAEDEEDDDDDKGGGGGAGVADKDELTDALPPPGVQEVLAPPLIDGEALAFGEMEPPEPMLLDPADSLSLPSNASGGESPHASALEALLSGASNFPGMLDLPPDADDETMVELAIALSLQEEASGRAGGAGAHAGLGLQGLRIPSVAQGSQLETGHLSDTTASAPGSDDEGLSTAATDGSNLRTSPAEQAGSAGSESGGSNIDSVSVSGRSSAYGETTGELLQTGGRSETSSVGVPSTAGVLPTETEGEEPTEYDADTTHRWHVLRLMLLEHMTGSLPDLRDVGGVRAIPFMQVVLMLTSDLEGGDDKDKASLDMLLSTLLGQLAEVSEESSAQQAGTEDRLTSGAKEDTAPVQGLWCRSVQHEVQLVIMRLLSVFMSRTKSGSKSHGDGGDKGSSESKPSHEKRSLAMAQQGCLVISSYTAKILEILFANGFFLRTLKTGLEYWKWKNQSEEQEGSVLPGQLLKPHPSHPPLDMSPFFLRQYVKSHANDVFEDYPQLLTEMILRLPYQIKKIAESSNVAAPTFDQKWFHILAEYMMTQQAPFVRRQVRKLLLYICGSKDKYRQLRDTHALETHMGAVMEICQKGGMEGASPNSVILPYDQLITLVEHLKSVSEVASSRTLNWQRYCGNHHQVLLFLVQAVITLDEAVSPLLLQLLQCALCGEKVATSHHTSPSKQKKDKENKDKDKDDEAGTQQDEGLCMQLVQAVSHCLSKELLLNFMRCFLLQSNSTAVRWQAHSLILHIYRCSNTSQQEGLLDLLWSLWGELPCYGRKGAQFVDLLGYFSLKTPQSDRRCRQYIERAVSVLRGQNKVLANHPNGALYNLLQGLVDFDGYYLESDPCLVCNNPEVPYSNLKLSSIKVDSKFTTCTQIVKLVGSHTISKINLRIADLKRSKMVRTLNFFYNNRTVQAVVELKNKTGIWHKAKKVVLSTGQTEVKVEFPLPITACNLMIEFADFYDNLQGTAETLQCPRCSASVPANPGVCGNCGENVFQCHKCRAINYDEKDPFLCNACGFCKYAKFDFTLYAKPCCAVDPIESEEDRKKAVSSINTLLEKADRLYRQLQVNRPALDTLLFTVSEHASPDRNEDLSVTTTTTSTGTSTAGAGASTVNKAIYQLAQKYCGDCKGAFDELSKIIQKIIASRRELVEYDRQQRETAAEAAAALPSSAPPTPDPSMIGLASEVFPKELTTREMTTDTAVKEKESRLVKCYGCASATVEHCVTLLRALSTNAIMKSALCQQGLIKELINYNLKRGSAGVRYHVRLLLCLLTRDNAKATEELNSLLTQRIVVAIQGHLANPDFASSVRHEMMLLANTVVREDKCWEARIRAVLKLFLVGMKINSPDVLEFVCLPCLRILKHLIKPETPTSKKNKDKAVDVLCSVKTGQSDLHVDVRKFLAADPRGSYETWRHNIQPKSAEWLTLSKKKKEEKVRDKELEKRMTRVKYLMEKYGHLWRQKTVMDKRIPLLLSDKTWLRRVMFSPSSRSTRDTACRVVEAMCQLPGRKQEVIDMLTSYLEDIGKHGESSREYLALYKSLISTQHWKLYLTLKGVLTKIGQLISKEIDRLTELEETSLSSDLSLGYSLKALTELMAMFVEEPRIKQHFKNRLVGVVLNGYLSLKRLVVQRTKLIDLTQEELLDLLEDMTTGTEAETKEFMSVCVETVKKYPLKDQLSPVFIFERLCSIIFPEENDVGEFFLSLEKDPQQEDFLQGRMLGNPYSSNEPGLGPLMRDIKNKICTDCELVALLEDDTGMELLVNNKIISLNLPVKDVYKKIWSGENEPMRVVYRMRGLLGDATEDMVNSLDSGKDEGKDAEEVYKMAAVLSDNGGLRVMLQRLSSVRDLVSGKQLLSVLLKLFAYCTKVKVNRQQLIKPEMNTISIMLGALNLALLAEQESGTSTKGQTLTERILAIMEHILQEASSQTLESYKEFSKLCGDQAQLMMLLDRINSPFVRANPPVLQALMKLIPFLAFGDQDKMLTLVNHFKNYLNFDKYDVEHTEDEQVHLDCFCVIADGIETNANGERLKDMILSHNIPGEAIDYIMAHSPEIKTLLPTDSDKWKDFLSKPSLPFCLRILAGLCKGHLKTQIQVGKGLISILHKLEQVSSEGSIGSLAENLMEALRGNQLVAEKIEEIRQKTKAEKKRLAMAVRQKHLKGMGMTTNEKGQVKAESSVLKQMEDLKEETGLVCCICREGYRYQPTKVLGIYTYTKRVNLESLENKPRKSPGYSTVSHFNVVHIDCHLEAVRLARGREEWESAVLQNANTRCNGLLPLWGPTVPESAFASCLVRHNTYLQDCTGMREPSYPYTVHDLKHLLMKFTFETSFSEDSGGGGRQSNVHLVAYMMHLALYVINTTRAATREEKNINHFLQAPKEKWLENCFEPEGVLFYMAMTAHILPKQGWMDHRVLFLKRALLRAHVGVTGQAAGETSLKEKTVKAYSDYKPYLLYWALIGDLYQVLYKQVKSVEGEAWPVYLAEYIRQNDQVLLQQSDRFLAKFEEELLPVESFMEFCDVAGLLEDIPDPDNFLSELMASLP